MSRTARVERFFGEKPCSFQLGIDEAMQLEEIRGESFRKAGFSPGHGGVMAIHGRLADGLFVIDDVRETLRLGLIGGGMEREPAYLLAQRHVVPGYLAECATLAGKVTSAFLIGAPDDTTGDASGEPDGPPVPTQPGSPTAAFDGAGSTDSAASSGSAPPS